MFLSTGKYVNQLLPFDITKDRDFQDFRIVSEHSADADAKSAVTTRLNASHGVSPVNCKIGAEAAIALLIKRPGLISTTLPIKTRK